MSNLESAPIQPRTASKSPDLFTRDFIPAQGTANCTIHTSINKRHVVYSQIAESTGQEGPEGREFREVQTQEGAPAKFV